MLHGAAVCGAIFIHLVLHGESRFESLIRFPGAGDIAQITPFLVDHGPHVVDGFDATLAGGMRLRNAADRVLHASVVSDARSTRKQKSIVPRSLADLLD